MHRSLRPIIIRREPLNIRDCEFGSLLDMLIRKPLPTTAGSIECDEVLGREIFF